MKIEDLPEIHINDLKPGYLGFLNGTTFLAKRIKDFQRMRFGKDSLYQLNHAFFIDVDPSGRVLSFEQDQPGKFHPNVFDTEYVQTKSDICIGIPKCSLLNFDKIRYKAELLTGDDKLLNYSYKSFLSFMSDAITYKLFKKDSWITGEPTGSTCSQITAKLFQLIGMFASKVWYKWWPCEIAMSEEITLYRLVF